MIVEGDRVVWADEPWKATGEVLVVYTDGSSLVRWPNGGVVAMGPGEVIPVPAPTC